MKLRQYLDQNNLSAAEFGRRIGVSRMTVIRYASGARKPEEQQMREIFRETKGSVTPNDFYGLADEVAA